MSLSPRSIAVGGVGFGARNVSVLGMTHSEVTEVFAVFGGGGSAPSLKKSKIKMGASATKSLRDRQNEALLLVLLH